MKYLFLLILIVPFKLNAQDYLLNKYPKFYKSADSCGMYMNNIDSSRFILIENDNSLNDIKKNKIIMLCIDTSFLTRKALYPPYLHTLYDTPLSPNDDDLYYNENYYDERVFWKIGYCINGKYCTLNESPLSEKLVVLLSYKLF